MLITTLIRQGVDERHIHFKSGELLVKTVIPHRVSIARSKIDFAVTVESVHQTILLGQIEMKKVEHEQQWDLSSSSNFRQTVCYSITSLAYSRWGVGKDVLGDRPLVSILLDQDCLYKLIFTKPEPAEISENPFRLRLRVEIYSNPSKMYEVLAEYTHQLVTDFKDMQLATTLSTVYPSMWSPINFDLEEADARFGNTWNLGFVFKAKGSRILKFFEDLNRRSSLNVWASGMSKQEIKQEAVYYVKCLHSILTLGWKDSAANVVRLCGKSIAVTKFNQVKAVSCSCPW